MTNTLRLLDLPGEVQQFVEEGSLTAGHARAILAVPSEEGRIKLAQKVVEEKLSVRQTETLALSFLSTLRLPHVAGSQPSVVQARSTAAEASFGDEREGQVGPWQEQDRDRVFD